MLGVCWMIVILPCCISSHAFLHKSPEENKVPQLKIHCLTEQRTLFVPCPNVSTEDAMFQLYKDQKLVCQQDTKGKKQCNQSQPSVRLQNETNPVGFNLSGLPTAGSQGIYRCDSTTYYPAPVKVIQGNQPIVVIPTEQWPCNKTNNCTREEQPKPQRFLWIWITTVSLLSTYSIAVTIVAFNIWFKLKGEDYQNDYINTKPKAPRNRRKNKGLQTPIPRYV